MPDAIDVNARRALRARLKETLTSTVPPELSEDFLQKLEFDSEINPHKSVGDLGPLPLQLQHLYVLLYDLEKASDKERHRRCVDFFEKEDYDNERIEYMIWCEVGEDPRFNQSPKVKRMLEQRIRRHWPQLMSPDGHEVYYFIDTQLHVHTTNFRKKTEDEFLAEIKESNRQLAELTQRHKDDPTGLAEALGL